VILRKNSDFGPQILDGDLLVITFSDGGFALYPSSTDVRRILLAESEAKKRNNPNCALLLCVQFDHLR
jgi:hypothetical protein